MNSFVTIADIKRGGMAALDVVLRSGPAYIMKRNRPVAVVMSQEAYGRLLARAEGAGNDDRNSAIDFFLAPMPAGSLDRTPIDQRLARSAAEWQDR